MYCQNCGKQLSETAKFCTGCGSSVEAVTQPQVTGGGPPENPPQQFQTPPGGVAPNYNQQTSTTARRAGSKLSLSSVIAWFSRQPRTIQITIIVGVVVLAIISATTDSSKAPPENTNTVAADTQKKTDEKLQAALSETFSELDGENVYDWAHVKEHAQVRETVVSSITDLVIMKAVDLYGKDYAKSLDSGEVQSLVRKEVEERTTLVEK